MLMPGVLKKMESSVVTVSMFGSVISTVGEPEVVEKLEMIGDLGEGNAKYAKLWDEIKAGE